eukprot:TRINITY_DN9250_c0_g1_i1.p1 TRINITY_DN9250_c0_g1~~TRINITY_DN9250_c0_g1_i1.p1  ORF type:complete len:140 (-),score=22.95 TRINITY_DN9250_c0_g1_i1:42-461(-)
MWIAAIAVIGKQNNPLYIKTLGKNGDDLKFHHIVHTSLDVVQELTSKKESTQADKYLGQLYPTEEYKVYGYITNTRIKFILIVDYDSRAKEADLKQFFTKFHELYADTVCNPFYTFDENITSQKFEERVTELVSSGVPS